jgi:hypothetical protein
VALLALAVATVSGSRVRAEERTASPSSAQPQKAKTKASPAFTHGPEYTLVPYTKAKIKRTALAPHGGVGATIAPDGTTYFTDAPRGGKQGGVLASKSKPQGVFFATPEVHDVEFSPTSKYVAVLDDEKRQVSVLSVPAGKVVRQLKSAYLARFRSDDVLLYRTLCQLFEVDLATSAEPRAIGPNLCGGASASSDGKVWIVVQPSQHGVVLSLRDFSKLTRLDGVTGATERVSAGSSFHDPSVTPEGKRICYGNSGVLSCVDVATGQVDTLGSLDAARLDWANGDKLMLGAARSEIVVADFGERTIRRVSDLTGIRYWRFLPGGNRIYVYNKGSRLFDLKGGISIEIYGKKTEVGGFVPVPGRDDRFVTGNEVGSGRSLYWIDVTVPQAKTPSDPKSAKSPAADSKKKK